MFVTYSVLFGMGSSFIFTASFLITAKNFRKWQSLAVGVVSVGGSIGILVMGPFLQLLLDMVGWRGTYRIISAVLCLVCVCATSFGDPVEDDDNTNKNLGGLLQPDNMASPSIEAVSPKDIVKSANSNDLKREAFSKSANTSSERCGNCAQHCACASETEILASSGEGKTLTSVTYTEDVGNNDVKVENKGEIGKLMDFSVFKVPSFTILVISLTLMSLGHYTPQLHLVSNRVSINQFEKYYYTGKFVGLMVNIF